METLIIIVSKVYYLPVNTALDNMQQQPRLNHMWQMSHIAIPFVSFS